MNNFIYKLEEKLKSIIKECGYDTDKVTLVTSSRPDLGEYQYNGVMGLAKVYKKNPNLIANEIVERLKLDNTFSNVNVAGPGFINLSFSDEALIKYMNEIKEDININKGELKKKKIIIDYGGPNVAKALHVGHLRSANIGEALKRLAKCLGCEVIGDVHLGDWGRPLGLVILELKKRHPDWVYFDENYDGEYPTESPVTNEDLEEIYPIASSKAKEDDEYLEEARIITSKFQKKEKGYYDLWKKIVEVSVANIKSLYDKLNVNFELWKGESDADKYVPDVVDFFKDKGLLHESEGAQVIDVKREDDKIDIPPLIIIKSNGTVSYDTTDVATIWERVKEYNPDEIWYVVDSRQSLHFEQVFRACYKSGIVKENVLLDHMGFGTMNGKDGKPFKTRDGGVMTLSNLIDNVKAEVEKKINTNLDKEEQEKISNTLTCAVLKYADLLPNRSTDYIFDIEKFSDMNGKTGVYLLYSTMRMKSLLAKAKENDYSMNKVTGIYSKYEKDIILKLLEVPSVLEKSYNERTLNYICDYLYELTNTFNSFYASVKILTEEDSSKRESYLSLSEIVFKTNQMLLNILGIDVLERM